MRITQEADYALRVVNYLSVVSNKEMHDSKTISEECKIPKKFFLKLVRKLVANGIVISYRGVAGGYALAKEPEKISILDVIVAIDGPIVINRCLCDDGYCSREAASYCGVHKKLEDVQQLVINRLSKAHFGEVAAIERRRKRAQRREG